MRRAGSGGNLPQTFFERFGEAFVSEANEFTGVCLREGGVAGEVGGGGGGGQDCVCVAGEFKLWAEDLV